MKWLCGSICVVSALFGGEAIVRSHDVIKLHSMYGNSYRGLATKEMGAKEFEIWRASLGVGGKSPPHVHETEKVFVLLKGHIKAIVGGKEYDCVAPATLICPANVPHQLINVGDEPSDQILVLGVDSKICDMKGEEIHLPWR